MHRIIFLLLLIGLNFNLKAQDQRNPSFPITVSYWGHHISHPGIKVGSQYHFKKWDKAKERKKGTFVKHKTLFLNPQLGFYQHQKNHTGVLLNAEFGVEIAKNEKKFFRGFSLGLGYIRQFNAGTTYILEPDNSISENKWASRGYFMPSINCEMGQHFHRFSWFTKFSFASKMKYNTSASVELFFEAGGKFYLKK